MRATFAFAPKASPTYVPLGLASLVPCVRNEVPACSVQALDLNIEAWDWVTQRDMAGEALLRFFRGFEAFYDEHSYRAQQHAWSRIRGQMGLMAQEAVRYVASGSACQEFLLLLEGLAEKTLSSDPELVGLSALFLEQIPFALALARRIKERSLTQPSGHRIDPERMSPRLVLGGAALSALREDELLRACSYVDAILVGEGEPGAVALCSERPFTEVPGLVYRTPSGIRRNKRSGTVSLHGLPTPDFSCLPLDRYFNPRPVLPVLFSRGCRWRKCRFCAHNASFAGYRRKGAEAFVDELEEYQRMHGASHFYLADQYVEAADLDRVADEILRRRLEVFFHVMGKPTEEYTSHRTEQALPGRLPVDLLGCGKRVAATSRRDQQGNPCPGHGGPAAGCGRGRNLEPRDDDLRPSYEHGSGFSADGPVPRKGLPFPSCHVEQFLRGLGRHPLRQEGGSLWNTYYRAAAAPDGRRPDDSFSQAAVSRVVGRWLPSAASRPDRAEGLGNQKAMAG